MPTIHFRARVFATADEAFQHLDASGEGDHVIALRGKHYVLARAEAQRLDAAGIAWPRGVAGGPGGSLLPLGGPGPAPFAPDARRGGPGGRIEASQQTLSNPARVPTPAPGVFRPGRNRAARLYLLTLLYVSQPLYAQTLFSTGELAREGLKHIQLIQQIQES